MSLLDQLTRAKKRLERRLKPWPEVELHCPKVALGSDYGGYAVNPVGLNASSIVYSFGVGEDVSFDLALIARYGMTVHAFDPTPRSIAWFEAQSLPDTLVLHPWGLSDYDGSARFTPPHNPDHVSHTMLSREHYAGEVIEVPVLRLSSVLARLGHDRVDVLKMDIEGAEYTVLDDVLGSGVDVGQILVEFHHHLPEVPEERTERSLAQLKDHGYRLFHVSSSGHELSFLGPYNKTASRR